MRDVERRFSLESGRSSLLEGSTTVVGCDSSGAMSTDGAGRRNVQRLQLCEGGPRGAAIGLQELDKDR